MTIVIVMPTYNEASCINEMIGVLMEKVFPEITAATMHLLVVDDDSPDGTGRIVRDLALRYPNLHLLTGPKKGLGWAYVRGMRHAMSELHASAIIEMDSDFQHDPRYIAPMARKFLDGADYVIGSRYVRGGSVPASWQWHRKFLSYWGNQAARLVLKTPSLHDLTTGFRLSRVIGVLDRIDLENLMALDRFAFKIDLFWQTTRFARRIEELPIHFQERSKGATKFSLRELAATGRVLLRLRARDSRGTTAS